MQNVEEIVSVQKIRRQGEPLGKFEGWTWELRS